MKTVLFILLLAGGSGLAAECSGNFKKSIEVGGDKISANVSKGNKPMRGARARLYFNGKLLGTYRTNDHGGINIYNFYEGEYSLSIKGLGSTTIRFDPKLDWPFLPQQPSWNIVLSDHGCAAWAFSVG